MKRVPDLNPSKQSNLPDPFPQKAVLIIGAGHFGARATMVLGRKTKRPLFVVDKDEKALRKLDQSRVTTILQDGILFLVDCLRALHPQNIIIPAVPDHLAFRWLEKSAPDNRVFKQKALPKKIERALPFVWYDDRGSLLVSYADFVCPDDCPEPANACTVTGKRRPMALHRLLQSLDRPDLKTHIIRSRQIAPGMGGYRVQDLIHLAEKMKSAGEGQWMLGTACKCHGVLTGFTVEIIS